MCVCVCMYVCMYVCLCVCLCVGTCSVGVEGLQVGQAVCVVGRVCDGEQSGEVGVGGVWRKTQRPPLELDPRLQSGA